MQDFYQEALPQIDKLIASGSSSETNKRRILAHRCAMDLIMAIKTDPSCKEQENPVTEEDLFLQRMHSKRNTSAWSREHAEYKNDPYCYMNDHRPRFRTISPIWIPYNQDGCGGSSSSRQSTLLRTLHHSAGPYKEPSFYAAGSRCNQPSPSNPPQVRPVQDLLSSMPMPAIRCQSKEVVAITDKKPKVPCEGGSVAGVVTVARTNDEDNTDLPASILTLLEAENKAMKGSGPPAFGLPQPSPPHQLNAKPGVNRGTRKHDVDMSVTTTTMILQRVAAWRLQNLPENSCTSDTLHRSVTIWGEENLEDSYATSTSSISSDLLNAMEDTHLHSSSSPSGPSAVNGTLKSQTTVDKTDTTINKPRAILRKGFNWKDYPELEPFLIQNRDEYLYHSSALNYSSQQRLYNNRLTGRLIEFAESCGYVFDPLSFTFAAIRDRIRCFFKTCTRKRKMIEVAGCAL